VIKLSAESRLSPQEVTQRAIEFFGPEGYGLEITDQSDTCAYFKGGGGSIEVTACSEENKTEVTITSREWDYQVRQFLRSIG
jgi:hypothetical protein